MSLRSSGLQSLLTGREGVGGRGISDEGYEGFPYVVFLSPPSLPGIAVRRTASLPLAYARQSIASQDFLEV
jgi:hypothetical protein